MQELLKGLNQEQVKAVEQTEGPLLILAGAGSGKTKTLTHRIAYLIREKHVAPQQILAVTFTNKAAGEMRGRVLKLLGRREEERQFLPYLGTFHSICVRLLRQDGEAIDIPRNFVIFDESDSKSAIKLAMRELSLDEKKYKPNGVKSLISSAKSELIEPIAYAQLAEGPFQEVAASVYPVYQRLLKEANALDFDDLLNETVRLLKNKQAICDKWQSQFKYVLVDEYQDTNHAQYQLTRLLTGDHQNICVVGDDWQSVYSWRGADFKNILNFERDYPKATVIKLEQNYRSTKRILEAAQAVIDRNTQRSDKKLWTRNHDGAPLHLTAVSSEIDEAEQVVSWLKEGLSGGRSLSDFAVLYRTNAQSRALEEAFVRYSIPYKIVGGVRFYDRKEIKDVIAYLRFLYQPDDHVSFKRIINLPPRGLGAKSLERFDSWRAEHRLTIWEALARAEQIDGLTPRARTALAKFYKITLGLKNLSEEADVAEVITQVLKRTGYLDYVNDGSIPAAERVENVQELISQAAEYRGITLAEYLEEVALLTDLDEYDASSEAATLMTLHAAKGLEFPVVIMAGLEEGIFPHSRSFYDPSALEEERRLCYVGMTRAREELRLVYANSRLLFGSVMHNAPSRFLSEISLTAEPAETEETEPETYSPGLAKGDKVRHPVFGAGRVMTIEDTEAVIEFAKIGSKRLNLAYAPLEKA